VVVASAVPVVLPAAVALDLFLIDLRVGLGLHAGVTSHSGDRAAW